MREFRISNIKATSQTLQQLFDVLENVSSLRKLRLAFIDIKSDLLLRAQLNRICLNGDQLVDLDLSGLGLLPNQLSSVMSAIEESCVNLQYLNLSHNALSADIRNEHSITFCNTLVKVVEESDRLQHLNLSNMCL